MAEPTDSRDLRPPSIVLGAVVAMLRGLWLLLLAVSVFVEPESVVDGVDGLTAEGVEAFQIIYAVVFGLAGVLDLVLAWSVMRGHNWARLLIMALGAFSVGLIAVQTYGSRVEPGQLPVTALTIFVLLALSSHRAREWSTRRSAQDEDLGARIVSKMM